MRYFGGILLGASGLVRAYGKAATASLDNAKTVIRKLCHKTSVSMDYTLYGKLLNYLESSNIPICSSEFTSNVEVVLLIEEEKRIVFIRK